MTNKIRFGDAFLTKALSTYPQDRGFDYGGPRFGEFMSVAVRAARLQFEKNWDNLPNPDGLLTGPVRIARFADSGVFGPIDFYGALVGDDEVEIADFTHDPEFFDRFSEDEDLEG
ncbi:hypothetical protein [Pseudofrankia sp. BMG5.37]|uniref:hypothetical protein n=1 Tax=Pseudofrankia sp. BMG5.37 TaxID=3050035 RepID=UPI002895741B|nr:hypothetical protein [Pseudofrankia sp. BMG5.37]MDT3441476.1 hypothetical protein [Pseudofrankia sp. BMG5.37]